MRATNSNDILKIKEDADTYEDMIIKPDGEIINANYGHINALERIYGMPYDLLYKIIAIQDNPQFWLIEKTRCISVSFWASFGMPMTKEQNQAYQILVKEKIIRDNFFDITEERKKASYLYGQEA